MIILLFTVLPFYFLDLFTYETIAFDHWGFLSDFGQMPNNLGDDQHCVHFYISSVRWNPPDAWNDIGCDGKNRFICEKVKKKE